MQEQEQTVTLKDKGNTDKQVEIKIKSDSDCIAIFPSSYGEKSAQDGYGAPVLLEIWDGELRVVVWSDINDDDPTDIISLEGAREDTRIS